MLNIYKRLGKKHGFEVSDFYWGDRLVDEIRIEQIKRNMDLKKKELIAPG